MIRLSTSWLLVLLPILLLSLPAHGQKCLDNLDFEKGDLSNWRLGKGICCPITINNFSTTPNPNNGRHSIQTGNGTDYWGGFPVVSPGSQYSLKLGNDRVGAEAESASYNITIPSGVSKYLLIFRYAVVLQNPISHDSSEQPRFEVRAYDSATHAPLPCANFQFVSSSNIPGFIESTKPVNGDAKVYYKPWSAASLDLTALAGRTVTLEFATGDCKLGQHFGYAYVDVDCSAFPVQKAICNRSPTITLNAPPGFQSYEWRDVSLATVLGNSETLTVPTPAATAQYAVIVSPYVGFGCPDTIIMTAIISDLKIVTSKDTTSCNGSNVSIWALGQSTARPITYSWSPIDGLNCPTCADPVANLQQTMTYTVTVTDTNGCIATKDITVNRTQYVSASIKLPADTVCQYEHVILHNDATNPAGTVNFWSTDTSGKVISTDQSTNSGVFSWKTPGLHPVYLKATTGGCNMWDTGYIYVRPGPYAFFDVDANVCITDTFDILPAKQDAQYFWSIDGYNYTNTNYTSPIRISYNTLGRKRIVLTVADKSGCKPPPYDTVVVVHEYPLADIQVVDEVCYDDSINVRTIEGDRYIYKWEPVRNFVTNSSSEAALLVHNNMWVNLEVATEWNCRSYDSVYLTPKHCCPVFFPDAFTPNNDGLNDKFRPITDGSQNIKVFMITNRWGQILYSSTDQRQGWDGTYKGEKQDYGMYFYYLGYSCTDGGEFQEKGSFLLIR